MPAIDKLSPQAFTATGTPVAGAVAPFRREEFTEGDDPATRTRQLRDLQKNVASSSEATRGDRHSRARYFKSLTTTVGGVLVLRHGLGEAEVFVNPVRWAPTVPFTAFGWDTGAGAGASDGDTVRVFCHAAGVVTLEVF
jgi:hypothetical protein